MRAQRMSSRDQTRRHTSAVQPQSRTAFKKRPWHCRTQLESGSKKGRSRERYWKKHGITGKSEPSSGVLGPAAQELPRKIKRSSLDQGAKLKYICLNAARAFGQPDSQKVMKNKNEKRIPIPNVASLPVTRSRLKIPGTPGPAPCNRWAMDQSKPWQRRD